MRNNLLPLPSELPDATTTEQQKSLYEKAEELNSINQALNIAFAYLALAAWRDKTYQETREQIELFIKNKNESFLDNACKEPPDDSGQDTQEFPVDLDMVRYHLHAILSRIEERSRKDDLFSGNEFHYPEMSRFIRDLDFRWDAD